MVVASQSLLPEWPRPLSHEGSLPQQLQNEESNLKSASRVPVLHQSSQLKVTWQIESVTSRHCPTTTVLLPYCYPTTLKTCFEHGLRHNGGGLLSFEWETKSGCLNTEHTAHSSLSCGSCSNWDTWHERPLISFYHLWFHLWFGRWELSKRRTIVASSVTPSL